MVSSKARLLSAAGLFLAWIAFLLILVLRTRDPVVVSRPQLIVASLVVIADLQESDGQPSSAIGVKTVVWSLAGDEGSLVGQQLHVDGLSDCGVKQGWAGPGEYIVPLTKRDKSYEVTPLPLSPGYEPSYVTLELARVGPEKEKVAALIAELRGPGAAKVELKPGILRHNVPRGEAADFRKRFEEAGASVHYVEGETRIYRATADAMAQVQEVRPR